MAVRIIKGSWWIDFRFDHMRYRKRSPENTKAGALAYEALLRQKLVRGETLHGSIRALTQVPLFKDFAQTWLDEYVTPNNKYSERRTKKYILSASLVPFFGRMHIGQITVHHIEQYKAETLQTGVTNKTLNNRLAVLRKCLMTAHEWFQLETAPPRIKFLKCISQRTDYLSEVQCVALLSHTEGVLHEMILAALRTGMRQGELRGLQWSSIDWETGNLSVRHSHCDRRKILESPKSNRERYIPLDHDLDRLLCRRRESDGYVFKDEKNAPFDHYRLSEMLTDACKLAGLRRITWHVLRHTFATHLAMKGVPLNVVQNLLGHSSITTTMRYAHVAPSALRGAIETLGSRAFASERFGQPVGNQRSEMIAREAA